MTTMAKSAKRPIIVICCVFLLLFVLAENGSAVGFGKRIVYEGKGAGKVVFDGTVHASQGLECADCHEGKGLSFALFEMKLDPEAVTMRRMEKGRSCGHCHPVSMEETLNCDSCHHK